jgi:LPPG:FO 2-phospho-L-lactate transferase
MEGEATGRETGAMPAEQSPRPLPETITVLCGGVGAARFLTGAVQVVDPGRITAVVNTADDVTINGLSVSPDLDTVMYTLAGAIDPDRGWGLGGETWNAMAALERFAAVRPERSDAAVTWFRLGDRDIATHLYRTVRRSEGATLTDVTDELRRAWEVGVRLLPMTDGTVATRIVLADGAEIAFQDYFVRLRHDIEIAGVRIDVGDAVATSAAIEAIRDADLVVVAPSNPLVSIQPLRALPGVDEELAARRERVVAVSPIVGGHALKGPAERMLRELGHESTVVGVARLYAPIASMLVIDPVDAHLAGAVSRTGVRPIVTASVMSTVATAAALATATLAAR